MVKSTQCASYPSLKDRVVVISGGATGIGSSMVDAFASQGSQVIILDIQAEAASDLIQNIKPIPTHEPIYYQCDVTDIDGSVKPVASKILSRFPHIHILINNAASDTRRPTEEITPAQWDKDIAVNLRHTFFLTQSLLPGLIAVGSSASIINMGSINWAIPSTGLLPYATCKSAMLGMTRTLAHEYGPKGIRVNSIMPGAIATDRQKAEVITLEYEKEIINRQALKRILEPSEVATMALWLAADDSSAVTNQSIVVDGGWV